MRDLYRKLGIHFQATKPEVCSAIAGADRPTAAAASTILLNDRRRPVYDRNHRLLSTLARLRSRLGMTRGPFWAHGNFSDFTEGTPAAKSPKQPEKKEFDSLIVTRAFAPGRHRKRSFRSLRNREILLAAAGGVLSLIFLALVMYVVQWAG